MGPALQPVWTQLYSWFLVSPHWLIIDIPVLLLTRFCLLLEVNAVLLEHSCCLSSKDHRTLGIILSLCLIWCFTVLVSGTLHFIVLHFIVLCRDIFLQIERLWQPCLEQVYWHHFSNSICSLHVLVLHFGNSCTMSNYFIVIILCVMVICNHDLWCYIRTHWRFKS